jgi:predicted DCC family thiol-disulfide oxidoreductase YuxK
VGRAWNRFFFTPADPTPLGLIRVAVGLLAIWNLLVYGLDLHAFLGSNGWADPAAVRQVMGERTPWAWSFWLLVPDSFLVPVWLLCLLVLVLSTIGLWSRLTTVLAWVIIVSAARRVPVGLYGFDQVLSTLALYLAVCTASGQAVSLDRFLARLRLARAEVARRRPGGHWKFTPGAPAPTTSANLGLRLIQLHLVLIYGIAGLAKLQGQAWWTGVAAWGVVAAGEFRVFNLTWMAAYPLLLNLMTHAGLFLELSYPILIWVRVLRPLLITAMLMMHLGIDLTLGLAEFGLAMLAGNIAFMSGPWLRSLVAGQCQPAGRVLYDGACPRCRASMAVLVAADPDQVIEPVDLTAVDVGTLHPSLTPAACRRAMHLVRANGQVDLGFNAVRTLGLWIPFSSPLAIFGKFPGIALIGSAIYNALAANRSRDHSCTNETCGLHPPAAPQPPKPGGGAPAAAQTGRPST